MAYLLPQQVFFCTAGSYCVFLDIERDLYVAMLKTRFDSLRPWLSPPLDTGGSPPSKEMPSELALLARDLAQQGLLTGDALKGKSFMSVAVPTAYPAAMPRQSVMCNALRFSRFYRACGSADQRLTKTRIRDTIDFVRRRKTQRRATAPVSRTTLISLVSTFLTLRLFYSRPYLCLFDSLALIEYLAMYRIFPTWIFGVQGEPFRAHCWVQHDDLLLNDSLQRVSRLTPIMTV